MVDRVTKFFRKLDQRRFNKTKKTVDLIQQNKLSGLDIKPLKGRKDLFRCRAGNIRILFQKGSDGRNTIIDIDFRGNIYSNL